MQPNIVFQKKSTFVGDSTTGSSSRLLSMVGFSLSSDSRSCGISTSSCIMINEFDWCVTAFLHQIVLSFPHLLRTLQHIVTINILVACLRIVQVYDPSGDHIKAQKNGRKEVQKSKF